MGTTFTATYSPDDNKLRLYAASRLDADLYARVRDAGFSWAPKQELFVAPMWTPAREDFLLELAGEIEDEDKSLVERAEERADRFDGYQENRVRDAQSAEGSMRHLLDGIPLGQPILVGHHSERRARKDAERIEGAMRKAVTMWDRADYWTRRAAGALSHAKHKERPDVRTRRIKGLEADLRKKTRERDEALVNLTEWQAETLDEARVKWLIAHSRAGYITFGESMLYNAMERGEATWEDARDRCVKAYGGTIAWSERWIAHYENRLAYERAMLADGGGLAADRFDLQPGGMVLVRSEWSTILRVNRVGGKATSVRTNARFCSKVNYEEIKDYRPPTQERAEAVKKVTKLAPIVNYRSEGCVEMTKAQWARQYEKRLRNVEATEEHGAHRRRMTLAPGCRLAPVFVTDEKEKAPPAPEGAKAPEALPREPVAPVTSKRPTSEPRRGEEVREALKAGVAVAVAPQLFPTPPDLAARMVDLAEIEQGHRVLEPSAGTGNLVRAIAHAVLEPDTVAVEVDARLAASLDRELVTSVHVGDFLQASDNDLGTFDRVVMNPPFANADDVRHVRHAIGFLKPGGRLVAICAGGPRQERELRPLATYWERLPAGTFREYGTDVCTVLLTIEGPE